METPQESATGADAAGKLGIFVPDLCIRGALGPHAILSEQSQLYPLELTNLHATTLKFPPAAARAGLVAAGLADGLRDGGFGVRLRGGFGVRAALHRERGIEAHGGGGLRIGQDGLDCAERLAHERPGLLAPSDVLVVAGFDEGIAKSGRTQPVADGVPVYADELSGGGSGGTGGQQGESALLGRGQLAGGRHRWASFSLLNSRRARVRAGEAGLRRYVVD